MDNLKNIVVLKNLPSNVVDEAFVILKQNQKLEYIPKEDDEEINEVANDYIVKEAEMVISSYLNRNNNLTKREVEKLKRRNKKLKIANYVLSVLLGATIIICFFSWINLKLVAYIWN